MDDADAVARLRAHLKRLAVAGSEQRSLFADEADGAEALAAAFDRCVSLVRHEHRQALTAGQAEALDALARQLATMSRDGADLDADLWTDAAVRTSEPWTEVRRLAGAALDALDRTGGGAGD